MMQRKPISVRHLVEQFDEGSYKFEILNVDRQKSQTVTIDLEGTGGTPINIRRN